MINPCYYGAVLGSDNDLALHKRVLMTSAGWPPILCLLLTALGGCSSDSVSFGEDSGIRIDDPAPRAAGTDRFGCPLAIPSRWTLGSEAYALFCGTGCEPWGGRSPENGELWFIACVADETLPPDEDPALDVQVCVVSPVDGNEYDVAHTKRAQPLFQSCWQACPDSPYAAVPVLPDYCFE